ncbi:DUF1566 domain-containing protein [Desulfosediminicola ganghwensis]|uniref:DUF1566 domain-containing protein n=1 Tax=Desulfosediminicola ganghwensis TaxID=2569540 RepID=UPI0010ABEA14|nr:DUF1566 domain-containing protein [Desulfosediminicola ganghwensis]
MTTYPGKKFSCCRLRVCLTAAILLVALFTSGCALNAGREQDLLVPIDQSTFLDPRSGKHWMLERSGRLNNPHEVQQYIQEFRSGAGESWRLPTQQELYDLFARFDLKENGTVQIKLEGNYWLTDETGNVHAGTWEIGDQCGPSRSFFTRKAGYVRAVRP